MNICDMEYFIAAYELRSISRAAGELFISHQALSKRIGALEAELGAGLFYRSVSGLAPTKAGELFYDYATSSVQGLMAAKKNIRASQSSRVQIHLDVAHIIPYAFNIDAVLDFERAQNEYSIVYACNNGENCYRRLLSGEADIILANDPIDSISYYSKCLKAEDAYILTSADSPLVTVEPLDASVLRAYTLVGPVDYYSSKFPLESIFPLELGPRPAARVFHNDTPSSTIFIKRERDCYAVFPQSRALDWALTSEGIIARRIQIDEPVFRMCAVARKDRAEEPGIRSFMRYCEENLESILK